MSYQFVVMDYTDACEDVRAVFGVDSTVLSDDVISRLPNMPAAEIQVTSLVPGYATLEDGDKTKLQLAVVYHTAANCYQTVKTNLMRIETDNKTMGTRFNDVFKLTEDDLRKRAGGYISELLSSASTGYDGLLTIVKPSIDVITGS